MGNKSMNDADKAPNDVNLDVIEGLVTFCMEKEKEIVELSDEISRLKNEIKNLDSRLNKAKDRGNDSQYTVEDSSELSILVLDSVSIMRRNLIDLFMNQGFHVAAEAETAAEAITKFIKYRPKLVTADIDCPDMDGVEFINRIKTIDPDVNIIILSRSLTKSELIKVVQAGVVDCITKPIMPARLIRTIDKHILHKSA